MSAEELSKLSLRETMVTTRARAARARTSTSRSTQTSASSSTLPSPTYSIIDSLNGHRYDVTTFSDDLRRRAKQGLFGDSDIAVQFCKEVDDERPRYYFHLEDDITVELDSDRAPKCSCGANEPGKACKHIFWMLGQLTSQAPETAPIQLAQDGSSVRDKHPADEVTSRKLKSIATELDWLYQEGDLPDEEDMGDEIANMLSVFEPHHALPSEFKREDAPDLREDARRFRELRHMLLRHAVRHPALFVQLQQIVPPIYQQRIFFEKIASRTEQAFEALDEYINHGPTTSTSEALDVKTCAARIRRLVDAIEEFYLDYNDPDTVDQVAAQATAALIRILEEVSQRDYDTHERIRWAPMPPTGPSENNLFVCLIAEDPDSEQLFVLDALDKIADQQIVRDHKDDLADIEATLRGIQWTPPAYMEALRGFLNDTRKRAASDSGGNTAKRPMQG